MNDDHCIVKHLQSKPGLKIVCAERGKHQYSHDTQLPDDIWFVVERADDSEPAIIEAAKHAARHFVLWLRLVELDTMRHNHTTGIPKSVFRWEHSMSTDAAAEEHQWTFLLHMQAQICELLDIPPEELPAGFITGFGST